MKHRFLIERTFWEKNKDTFNCIVAEKKIEVITYDEKDYKVKLINEINKANEAANTEKSYFLFIYEKTGVLAFNLSCKKKEIVCATLENEYSSYMTRLHNNSNVAVFNSQALSTIGIIKCMKIFIETDFEGGRHQTRVNMLKKEVK